MSEKCEPKTILGVNARLRKLIKEVESNGKITKTLIEAESNAAVHYVAEEKKK